MLFIICTPDLADHLMDAPHVDRVFMNDDVPVEVLQCNAVYTPLYPPYGSRGRGNNREFSGDTLGFAMSGLREDA